MVKSVVRHGFDRYFLFSKPPEICTVKGLSAVVVVIQCEHRLCSQSRRATTCATPRYFYINFFLISLFSSLLCPPSCGSRNLFGSIVSLDIPTAAPKNARFFCHRQRSRFLPKAGALPPALHLDTAIIWIQLKYYSIINPSCQLLSILILIYDCWF